MSRPLTEIKIVFSALLMIVVMTLFPFDFSSWIWTDIIRWSQQLAPFVMPSSSLGLVDVSVNMLLFLPLGFGLTGLLVRNESRGWMAAFSNVLIACAALSCTIEFLQSVSSLRHPSLNDVVGNCLGAALGIICFRIGGRIVKLPSHRFLCWLGGPFSKSVVLAASVVYFAITLAAAAYLQSATRLRNWDPTFSLVLV